MYKILFLVLFSSSAMFGLNVTYTPNTLSCGLTTVTGDFDCNFNGLVQISISGGVVHNQTGTGPLVSVSNGMMTFDITIDATDSSPFIISGEVKVTNMPACAAVDEPFSTSLTHGCTPAPANDLCAGAELLTINLDSCTPVSYETANQTNSGVVPGCGSGVGRNDLWYEFVASSGDLTIEFDNFPGNLMYITIFNGCGGSVHQCTQLFGVLDQTTAVFSGLTTGNTYKIQVLTPESASGTGTQDICLHNDVVLAIDDIQLALTNHSTYNELVFNSSKEATKIQVERKVNEEPSFDSIEELDVVGDNEYIFEDKELDRSGIYTYRLKIFDVDGIASYSNLVSTNHTNEEKFNLKVYPNPCSDIINFEIGSYSTDDNFSIQILNSDLKNIRVINNFNDLGKSSVDISDLNKGIYFARIITNVEHKMMKFIKI